MRRLPLISFIALILLAACGKTPDYVIDSDKMAELMADIYTAEAFVEASPSNWRTDSSKQALRQAVYARHNVSSEDVDTSLYWYGHNLKEYMAVYEKSTKILESRIAEAERTGGKTTDGKRAMSIDGDSVNVWDAPATVRVTPLNPTQFLTFTLSSDRNWERGDRYTLSLKPLFTRSNITLSLAVNYSDGITEYVTLSDNSESRKQLTLVFDSAKVATNVYGSILYTPAVDEISYLDSISLVRTRTDGHNAAGRIGQNTIKSR